MATVEEVFEEVLDESHPLIKAYPDDEFLRDLFAMQSHMEQRRKETLDSWIAFLQKFDPKPEDDQWELPELPETD